MRRDSVKAVRPAPAVGALLVLVVVPLTFLLPAASADEGCLTGEGQTHLFLRSGGKLSPNEPTGGGATVAFKAGTGVRGTLIGTWRSAPLEAPIQVDGGLKYTFYASGSGGQQGFYFQTEVTVGKFSAQTPSEHKTLTSSPTTYVGSVPAGFCARPGDSIQLRIHAFESGAGGNLHYDSHQTDSEITFPFPSVLFGSITGTEDDGVIRVNGTVTGPWGSADIKDIQLRLLGPDAKVSGNWPQIWDDELVSWGKDSAPSRSTDGPNFTWEFDSRGKVKEKGTYVVMLRVTQAKGPDIYKRVFSTAIMPAKPKDRNTVLLPPLPLRLTGAHSVTRRAEAPL